MIIRAEKRGNFSIILNDVYQDKRLSAKAKGIMGYLLTKPDHWKVMISDLAENFTDGKTAIRTGLNELIKFGYISKKRVRDLSGRVKSFEYVVYETPLLNQDMGKPEVENPNVDKPFMENQLLINTDNKKILKIANTEDFNIADFGNNGCFTDSCESVESSKESSSKNIINYAEEDRPCNFSDSKELPFYLTRRKRKLTGKRLHSFNEFWEAFNFKQGKADAAEEWLKIPALTDSLVENIVNAAKREAENRPLIILQGRQPKWAAGWIDSRRWEDEQPQSYGASSITGTNNAPSVIGGGIVNNLFSAGRVQQHQRYSNAPVFGQPTLFGFASTGNKRSDNNLAACLAFANNYKSRNFEEVQNG